MPGLRTLRALRPPQPPFPCWIKSSERKASSGTDIAIASRYAELVEDTHLARMVLALLRAEWQRTIDALLKITAQATLLERNRLLARSIRYRSAYLDPLNHIQIELLKRHRAGDTDELVLRGIHRTINGIAAGLRNTTALPANWASSRGVT